jgi:hypothetical protein
VSCLVMSDGSVLFLMYTKIRTVAFGCMDVNNARLSNKYT